MTEKIKKGYEKMLSMEIEEFFNLRQMLEDELGDFLDNSLIVETDSEREAKLKLGDTILLDEEALVKNGDRFMHDPHDWVIMLHYIISTVGDKIKELNMLRNSAIKIQWDLVRQRKQEGNIYKSLDGWAYWEINDEDD